VHGGDTRRRPDKAVELKFVEKVGGLYRVTDVVPAL
jgi:hypothetical protein